MDCIVIPSAVRVFGQRLECMLFQTEYVFEVSESVLVDSPHIRYYNGQYHMVLPCRKDGVRCFILVAELSDEFSDSVREWSKYFELSRGQTSKTSVEATKHADALWRELCSRVLELVAPRLRLVNGGKD